MLFTSSFILSLHIFETTRRIRVSSLSRALILEVTIETNFLYFYSSSLRAFFFFYLELYELEELLEEHRASILDSCVRANGRLRWLRGTGLMSSSEDSSCIS